MNTGQKLKLFISYSHADDEHIKNFITHIAPLKDNGLIEIWYDQNLTAGSEFEKNIDDKIKTSDIVCLLVSAKFMESQSCKKEKDNAMELNQQKGVVVVPIILSKCGWKDDKSICSKLALPKNGNSVTGFGNPAEAWHLVYEGLKKVIEDEIKIKQLEIRDKFHSDFLQGTDVLEKIHPDKEKILLDDIFVGPQLSKYDGLADDETKINFEIFLNEFDKHPKALIAGEDQSGKTTLCKKIFIELKKKNLVPVYICDHDKKLHGKIENRIQKALREQYQFDLALNITKEKIVPIIDNFHFAKTERMEKHIQDLSAYHKTVIISDDIFSLNIKNSALVESFVHFKINEFNPTLRNKLIRKWIETTDENNSTNEFYKKIDSTTNIVNDALGKIIGNGIMPAHPFFILTIIGNYEAYTRPLNEEITSQGHCYQALIYCHLRKQGIKNDDFDTYLNFFTEFAFHIFDKQKELFSNQEFLSFVENYSGKYNLYIKKEILLRNLKNIQIVRVDDCNNYSFYHQYLYYFFVARYLSGHMKENKKKIDNIASNLHKNEYAYIAIFISHHSMNNYILDEVTLNAMRLFENDASATLDKNEVRFLDSRINLIAEASLPKSNSTPEESRNTKLAKEDVEEEDKAKNENYKDSEIENGNDELMLEIRRCIKTVEVMGCIVKNRSGSLKKERLEEIFEEAMNAHLRFLHSFLDALQDKRMEYAFIDYVSKKLEKISKDRKYPLNQKRLEKISKSVFSNIVFLSIFCIIQKIVHSLGSDKLLNIISTVCDKKNTPASFMIKHGILMWYDKNLQVDKICEKMNEDDFSKTAERMLKFQVRNHCLMHDINYADRNKIAQKIGLAPKLLAKPSNRK